MVPAVAPTATGKSHGKTRRLLPFCVRHETTITLAETVIVFLALIRTLTPYYQLRTRPGDVLPAGQVQPIVTGSLVAALFCLALTLLSYLDPARGRHQTSGIRRLWCDA